MAPLHHSLSWTNLETEPVCQGISAIENCMQLSLFCNKTVYMAYDTQQLHFQIAEGLGLCLMSLIFNVYLEVSIHIYIYILDLIKPGV